MLDVSFSELLLIAVVALVVLGPEKLFRTMRALGFFWGRALSYFHRLRFDLFQEMHQHDVKRLADKPSSTARPPQAPADE